MKWPTKKDREDYEINGFIDSYKRLKHVIYHELVHVFMFGKMANSFGEHRIRSYYHPPLWFSEGLAEYFSDGWNNEADLILRDALINGPFFPLPSIWRINGSYLMYKEGQSVLNYLAETYGEDKIILLLENCWKVKNWEALLHYTYGISTRILSADWEEWLKKKYYPLISDRDNLPYNAKQITYIGNNLGACATFSNEDSLSIAFISPRDGTANIYYMPNARLSQRDREASIKKIITGGQSEKFEYIRLFHNKIASDNQGRLAFVSKKAERDVLYIMNIKDNEIIACLEFDELISLYSPTFSPDGNKIAFTGLAVNGYSDIFVVDWTSGEYQRLTNDLYKDEDIDWSPDGDYLVFSSDRGKYGLEGYSNLFLYNLDKDTTYPLTEGKYNDMMPDWSPDGDYLIFTSDRDSAFNLYLIDFATEKIKKLTNYLTGAFNPTWTGYKNEILFCGVKNIQYNLYSTNITLPTQNDTTQAIDYILYPLENDTSYAIENNKINFLRWQHPKLEIQPESKEYKVKFGLDFAMGGLNYDPSFGIMSSGSSIMLSDMLGDRIIYLNLSNSSQSFSNFFSSFNLGLAYVNLAHRLHYGYGMFHYLSETVDFEMSQFYSERRYGGLLTLSYPLSKFRRLDASFVMRRSERENYFESNRHYNLFTIYFSYVKDNTLWSSDGPLVGNRYNFSIGQTYDFRNGYNSNNYLTLSADWRWYHRLTRRSCYALRMVTQASRGDEAEIFYLGGSLSLRGYDYSDFWGNNLWLINQELRFPLLDHIVLRFPFTALEFYSIRGALFADLGDTWYDNNWEINENKLFTKGSFGAGIRLNLGYAMILRWDFSRRFNFEDGLQSGIKSQFFIGLSY